MHYLIIAVLAFALSMLGCEGKTGPAGPSGTAGAAGPQGVAGPKGDTGPQGPPGADGADGAQGPKGDKGETGAQGPPGEKGDQGERGPEGPQGPAGADGAAGIPGDVDITEIAKADHIAFIIGDAKAAKADDLKKTLRIGEDREIRAVLRSQSEEILESIAVVLTEHKDADDAILTEVDADDASMATVEAKQKGTATIRATAPLVGIAGNLEYTVTKPIKKVVFKLGTEDDAGDAPKEHVLAADEPYANEIFAIAMDEDNNVLTPRSNWTWDADAGVVTVTQQKDADKKLRMMGAIVKITGKGSGDTDVTAMTEGDVSGSFAVSVSGQSVTRRIVASSSTPGNAFRWDQGLDTPGYVNADGEAITATAAFHVNLINTVTNTPITAYTLTASPGATDASTGDDDPNVTASVANPTATDGSGGTAIVTVTPSAVGTGVDEDTYASFITLSHAGATSVRLRFTIQVIDSSEE